MALLVYLCGTDDGFASFVTSADHHLLREEYFLSGNLNAKVTTSHHDPVRCLENLIKPVTLLNQIEGATITTDGGVGEKADLLTPSWFSILAMILI